MQVKAVAAEINAGSLIQKKRAGAILGIEGLLEIPSETLILDHRGYLERRLLASGSPICDMTCNCTCTSVPSYICMDIATPSS